MPAVFASLAPQDQALLRLACAGLPLTEQPFADLGRLAGLSADSVLARLRALAASACIDGLKLVAAGPAPLQPQDAIEMELLDALSSGLPLVARPWEALGALLGIGAEDVRQRVQAWQQSGQLRCIAPTVQGRVLQA
jgi:DNA-binding Lrp family transcriptional regulator